MGAQMRLVGLAGKAGAGKDYTFEYIRNTLDEEVVLRRAFADGVRDEANDLLASDGVRFYQKPYSPEVRALLQWWGTDLRRAQDPDYWVTYAFNNLELDGYPDPIVVFTDVRFANEAAAIKERGGMVYEVKAPRDTRFLRLGGQLPPAHASEVVDFEVDGTILNFHTNPALPWRMWRYLEQR